MFTFARLGSGLAGLAGAFLSQIGNVGPSLGQSYIVDSFMTVVVGGVGNIFGTVVSAPQHRRCGSEPAANPALRSRALGKDPRARRHHPFPPVASRRVVRDQEPELSRD